MPRSGFPSPFTSPIATDTGPSPVGNVVCGAYDGVVARAAVVLSSTLTEFENSLTTTMSGFPSPLTSPTDKARAPLPAAKVVWGANDGVVAPAAVVFKSTPTEFAP